MEMRLNDMAVSQSRYRGDHDSKDKSTKLTRQIERITTLYRQKLEALKNADIRNAIMEEKNIRLTRQNEELEKENKALADKESRRKQDNTKLLNQQA